MQTYWIRTSGVGLRDLHLNTFPGNSAAHAGLRSTDTDYPGARGPVLAEGALDHARGRTACDKHTQSEARLTRPGCGEARGSPIPKASLLVKEAWGARVDTPNYNLIAHHAPLAHSGKGYCAITCRYIPMTEQLRLLYQLQANCSHSADGLALGELYHLHLPPAVSPGSGPEL